MVSCKVWKNYLEICIVMYCMHVNINAPGIVHYFLTALHGSLLMAGPSLHTTHNPLHNTHCILFTAHCTLLTAHWILCTTYYKLVPAHSTIFTVHCTLFSSHCTLFTAQLTHLTAHYTLHTHHCTLNTLHCTLNILHCTLHTLYCTLHTLHCTLHTLHCTLHTLYCTLHTLYCTLHTCHCTLHTTHPTLQIPDSTLFTAHHTQIRCLWVWRLPPILCYTSPGSQFSIAYGISHRESGRFLLHVGGFSLTRPLSRVSLVVAVSVRMFYLYPLPFLEASHWPSDHMISSTNTSVKLKNK